jgi:polar amino acid transport system substrate-binding protein
MSTKVRTLLFAILTCVVAACVPAAPTTQQVVQYDPVKTKMGQIQQRGTIVIGVPDNFYPFGYVGGPEGSASAQGKGTQQPAGFTVALGKLVAAALGVKAEFLSLPSARLLSALDASEADLVFPMTPITEAAIATHPFTDPYFIAHQRLLVPQRSSVNNLSALHGKAVCSAIDPKTEIPLTLLDPGISLFSVTSALRCSAPLEANRAVAATASDAALMGLMAALPGSRIVGDQLTTEGYGAAVDPCDAGFAQFVTRVFADAKSAGQWTALYRRWVQPASGTDSTPPAPTMTVIDASDLFPATGNQQRAPITCSTPGA